VAAVEPLALTDEMRSWTVAHLDGASPNDRLRELLAATRAGGPLEIAAILDPTPTAAEVFAARRADCVGYALLFVALARAAGVDVRFALWRTMVGSDDLASLHVRRGHLVAVYAGRAFDLDGETAADPNRVQVVSDRTALALFFSNRSAQALARGRPMEAVELGWRAVRYDPSLTPVWSNLGVALRRVGDTPGAVLAYEMALRIDPSDRSVRRNLALARGGPGGKR
jgi:tetratricopeptide (TPR) repeat protein